MYLLLQTPSQDQEKSLENSPIKLALENNFGSATSFINHFSSYAMGMFGTGYVWLVMDGVDNLAVVGTYGSGTVLVQGSLDYAKAKELNALAGSASKAGGEVSSGSNSPSSAARDFKGRAYSTSAVAQADFPERRSRGQSLTYTSDNMLRGVGESPNATAAAGRSHIERFKSIHPLLCLSLHPHVYIPDYGVWGKEEYIRNFWGNVNWELCYRRYQKVQELRR